MCIEHWISAVRISHAIIASKYFDVNLKKIALLSKLFECQFILFPSVHLTSEFAACSQWRRWVAGYRQLCNEKSVLTSNVTSGWSLSPLKYSILMVIMPWLKKRVCRKMLPFCENIYKCPSAVLVSKISFSCGKYSSNPFSNTFSTSFCATSSPMRLGSIMISNKMVCADMFSGSIGFFLSFLCIFLLLKFRWSDWPIFTTISAN